jgi:hypothetical protein
MEEESTRGLIILLGITMQLLHWRIFIPLGLPAPGLGIHRRMIIIPPGIKFLDEDPTG